jgi:hypothetical protein
MTMPRIAAALDRRRMDSHAQLAIQATVALPLLLAVPLLVVLLLVRRATGALVQPLPPLGLVACGALLGAWAGAAHGWLANYGASRLNRAVVPNWRSPRVWLPPAVLVLACYALWLPGSSTVGAAGLVVILVATETAVWGVHRRSRRSSPRRTTGWPAGSLPEPRLSSSSQSAGAASPVDEFRENVIAECIRRREADGREAIRGWVQAELAAGQRTVPVHVAFCPALAGLPDCEAEQAAGPPATIRVAQVLPYGARFEVKLDTVPARPVTVRVEFSATASAHGDHSG